MGGFVGRPFAAKRTMSPLVTSPSIVTGTRTMSSDVKPAASSTDARWSIMAGTSP